MTVIVLTIRMRPEPEPKPKRHSLMSFGCVEDVFSTMKYSEKPCPDCHALERRESWELKIKLYVLLKYGLTSLLSSFQLIICRKKGRLKYGFQAAAMLALWLSHDVESNPGPLCTIRSCSEKLIRNLSDALRYHLPVEGSLWSESVAEAAYAAGYSTDCQWNNPSGKKKEKLTTLIERATELGRLLSEMDCLPTEFAQFVKNLDDYEIQKELIIHYKVENFKKAANDLLGVKSVNSEAHKQVVLECTGKLRSLISEGFQSPNSHLQNNQNCPESNGFDTVQTTEVSALPVPQSIMESLDVDKGNMSMQLMSPESPLSGLSATDIDVLAKCVDVSWFDEDNQSRDEDFPGCTSDKMNMARSQATGSTATLEGNEEQNQNTDDNQNLEQRETGRLVNEHPKKYNNEMFAELNLQLSQSPTRDNTVFSDGHLHETSLTEGSLVKTCNGGTSSGTIESDNSIETADLTHEDTDCRGAGPDTSLALENETGQQIAEDRQFPSTEPDSEFQQQPTSLESFTPSDQDNRDQAKEKCTEGAAVTQTNAAFGTNLPGTTIAGSDNQKEITCKERFDAHEKEISKLKSMVNGLSPNSTPNRRTAQNRSEVNRQAADAPRQSDLEQSLLRPRLTKSTQAPTRKRKLTSPDFVSKSRRQ